MKIIRFSLLYKKTKDSFLSFLQKSHIHIHLVVCTLATSWGLYAHPLYPLWILSFSLLLLCLYQPKHKDIERQRFFFHVCSMYIKGSALLLTLNLYPVLSKYSACAISYYYVFLDVKHVQSKHEKGFSYRNYVYCLIETLFWGSIYWQYNHGLSPLVQEILVSLLFIDSLLVLCTRYFFLIYPYLMSSLICYSMFFFLSYKLSIMGIFLLHIMHLKNAIFLQTFYMQRLSIIFSLLGMGFYFIHLDTFLQSGLIISFLASVGLKNYLAICAIDTR